MSATLLGDGLPEGFVFLSNIDASIIEHVSYWGEQNFIGRQINGYTVNKIICTLQAAQGLKKAHDFFKELGYNLVVYDGYRPGRAVQDFQAWGRDLSDTRMQKYYYPTIPKEKLFELGFIAAKHSTHSRGSTFDLTLIESSKSLQKVAYVDCCLQDGSVVPFLDDNTVDMGTSFDFFHSASWHDSSLISQEQLKMRNLLRLGMVKSGFAQYQFEWWHYTMINEPYPDKYFDFVVEL